MGYEQFKAKKTFYNGVWFDSNLEARAAEAFDALGIRWEFHTICFRDRRFPYGQYTPDFKLSDGRYVEVAGVFDDRHAQNTVVLTDLLGSTGEKPLLIVVNGKGECQEWFKTHVNGERFIAHRTCYSFDPSGNLFKAAQGV